ncbi:LCP family protein [Leifsonia sp. NPDC058248]|uniref:LCP family protein n=1 Tax=Leifsonia sp. NPDC058248 TaxID=3346402 RepID=UPI0036DF2E09
MSQAPRHHERDQRTAAVRHGRLPRRRAVGTIAKILAAVIAVIAVSGVSVAAYAVWDVSRSIQPGVKLPTLPGQTQQAIPSVGAIDGGVNLLLAGTDTRSNLGGIYNTPEEQDASSGAGNNDVTMLLHIAQNHQSMMVISFPRDLMVSIPDCPDPSGHGTISGTDLGMFNSALSRGGLGCVVLTVEKLTGVQIPFAAAVDFNGVSAMSSAIGGVTVCLATPVTDEYTNPPLDLPAGQNTLVGDQALSFLRSRHGVGDGSDLGRISNQQVFLSALARKVVSGGVLSNPVQLYGLAKAAVKNITPSESLANPTTLVQIGLAMKDTGLGNMAFVQYPVYSDPDNANRVVVNQDAADVLDKALVNDQPVQITGTTGRAAETTPSPTLSPSPSATPTTTPIAPTSPATPVPSVTPTPGQTTVPLPSDITGQTGLQQTCTKGNN